MAKKKIKTGDFNPFGDKIERKDVMHSITMKIEGDLLDAIRKAAGEKNLPYQTLMKQMLRSQLRLQAMTDTELDQRLNELVAKHVTEALKGKKVG